MIYGSINFNGNKLQSNGRLEDVGKTLKWNQCISEYYFRDAFFGIFLTNGNNILNKEDIFYNDSKNELIIFLDGFVYNVEELSLQLGHGLKGIKAPELIFRAYQKWGETFAEHLNGDFAVCIYNKSKNLSLFYVDHLGVRPFAVSSTNSEIFFSTDPIGLSKALYSTEKIDPNYLINFFLRNGRDYMLTPHKSVIRIHPGHYYKYSKMHQGLIRYWFPEKIKTDYKLTQQQVIRDLRYLLIDSVNSRVDKKLSASAHLSGGFDSGIIAAIARKAYSFQEKFYGFSWSPEPEKVDEKLSDERSRVLEICRQNDLIPIFSNYKLAEYLDFISEWRYPSELVFEKNIVNAAKANGVNLIFSGWGGDEFLSISNRGIDADLFKRLEWKHFLKKYPVWRIKSIKSVYRELLYFINRKKYSKLKALPSVYPYIKTVLKNNRLPVNKRFHHRSRREVHLQLIMKNHIAARTADWYVNGQINGIEYRYPLLDKRIVEYMLKVPSKYLVNGNNVRIIMKILGKEFLPDDVAAKLSKSDTAHLNSINSIVEDAEKKFSKELDVFRRNPDLSFVDFDEVENDLPEMLTVSKIEKPIPANILHALKKAHEFTKGYYNRF